MDKKGRIHVPMTPATNMHGKHTRATGWSGDASIGVGVAQAMVGEITVEITDAD
jgi:hypothetical protein